MIEAKCKTKYLKTKTARVKRFEHFYNNNAFRIIK